ncbi:hypothetical protein [Glaciimonas sp. PAMC28666]|uniref:hypothetical protein n=1 Tax=Glaciimonas sp. PAMC28666 TaxID=2807626 RepID=UPI001962A5A9|nr:hypothetical protein [Glaciimonas sp. PAMC28666]QRX81611.1 hypothetical protein JQN73_15830 [Glaciimonas sp. PAMC28666]
MHQSERDWAKQNAKKYREHLQEKTGENISTEEAYQRLLSAGYAIVDSAAERGGKSDETAKQFIAENKTSTLFKATAAERTNPFAGGNVDGSWTPEQQARFGLKTPAEVASKLVTNANDYLGKSCSDNCGAKFDAINDALLALEATKPLYQDDLGSINLINAQIDLLKNGITETELVRGAAQSIAETDKAIAAALLGSGVKPAIPNNLVSSTVKAKLLTKLEQSGTKLTPENVVAIKKLTDGRIVFLEKGDSARGLQHIIERHATDFANKGISQADLPTVIMQAISQGKFVGKMGTASVYEITYNGLSKHIAVGVGNNGFIVTAFPVSSWKP